MLVFVATALAGTLIGWPCQRLNWGWRNVWSTCSIQSFAPQSSPVGSGFFQAVSTASTPTAGPTFVLSAAGVYTPNGPNGGGGAALPAFLCANAAATGSGFTANLRNRCRRAIDAYGALVKSCAAPAGIAIRGPNTLTPDWAPQAGHAPHVSNVAGLTQNAQQCVLPAGGVASPALLNTPSNTCPGLLGWFTVVFNACGFSNAPGLSPSQQPNTPYVPNYFPLGSTASPNIITASAVTPALRVGVFCQPITNGGVPSVPVAGTPFAWNDATPTVAGNNFRSSRCRKALDQFGRTASRCHLSTPSGTGPSQAGGFSDPLRILAVGGVPAGLATPVTPAGANAWAPACN